MKVEYLNAWGVESVAYLDEMPDSNARYKGEDKYSEREITLVSVNGVWVEPVWGVSS